MMMGFVMSYVAEKRYVPGGTKTVALPIAAPGATLCAASIAAVNAGVSSVTPSPFAPQSLTLIARFDIEAVPAMPCGVESRNTVPMPQFGSVVRTLHCVAPARANASTPDTMHPHRFMSTSEGQAS